jgi:hypothetical protein
LVVDRDGPYGRLGTVYAKTKLGGELGQYSLRRAHSQAWNSGFLRAEISTDGENRS